MALSLCITHVQAMWQRALALELDRQNWQRLVRKQGSCSKKRLKCWHLVSFFAFKKSNGRERRKSCKYELRNSYTSVVLHQGSLEITVQTPTTGWSPSQFRSPFRLPACKRVFRDSFMVPHTTFPEWKLRSPNTQISTHYFYLCWDVTGPSPLCSFSYATFPMTVGDTHTHKKKLSILQCRMTPAPFKHRYFHLLLQGHPACLNGPITGWIQDSQQLVKALGGEWSQRYSVKYSLDLFFTGVWILNWCLSQSPAHLTYSLVILAPQIITHFLHQIVA